MADGAAYYAKVRRITTRYPQKTGKACLYHPNKTSPLPEQHDNLVMNKPT